MQKANSDPCKQTAHEWAHRRAAEEWRRKHVITDWEFAEVGCLLCDHDPRDLALMVVRLEGQLEVAKQLEETRRG